MMRPPGACPAGLSVLALQLGLGTALASEGILAGRLTDTRGAAVAYATILVFAARDDVRPRPCEDGAGDRARLDMDREVPNTERLRSDARGAFSASLPAGRFVVAVMKPGYQISITQVDTRASRILQMRLQPSEPRISRVDPRDPRRLEADWFLRHQRADVLREEAASIPGVIEVADAPDAGVQAAAGHRVHPLLGPIDGDFVHSVGAQELLGLVDRAAGTNEGTRSTALILQAPLGRGLAWNMEGMSARNRIDLPDQAGRLAGGADQLAVGVDYVSAQGAARLGTLRALFGASTAGGSRIGQRLLEGSGELAIGSGSGRRLALGVRAWDGEADLEDGSFLTLYRNASLEPGRLRGRGINVYSGERRPLGALTRLDYGLEYRADSLSGEARAVPHVGVSHTLPAGGGDMAVRSELLLDPGRPGGVLAIQAAPLEHVQVSASLSYLPANAMVDAGAARPARAAAGEPATPGRRSASRREIGVEVTGNLGALSGSLSGSVGRGGPRSLPLVDQEPLLLVSFGSERFYETRLGVAYRPWEASVEVGYLRVESEARPEGGAFQGPPPDYGRLDLLLSKVLPAPRGMLGARLRALLEWQGLGYDSVLAANRGSSLSGATSRLCGGVGLTF